MLKATRIRRTVTMPALGVLLAGLFSLGAGVTASASEVGANAHPTDCHYEIPSAGYGAAARCNKDNGGEYRALVICKDPQTGKVADFHGGWRQYGWSYAYCQGSYRTPITPGVETRP